MTADSFEFPVLAFGPDRGSLGADANERFYVLRDRRALLTATRAELTSGSRARALLIDNSGRTRSIARIEDLGPASPIWQRILSWIFGQSGAIEQHIAYEFIDEAPLSFESVRTRVWASIQRNMQEWLDDEGIASEGGEPASLNSMLAKTKTAVDRSANLRELFENLDAAWPV